MNKQDILEIDDSIEIFKALRDNPRLYDKDIKEHLHKVVKAENLKKYGDENVLVYLHPINKG